MLRRNLSTEYNLVNGALRTITDIVVDPNSNDSMPMFVMVQFDNYNGTTINGSDNSYKIGLLSFRIIALLNSLLG